MQQQNQLPGHSVPGLNRMAAEDGHDPQPQHAIHTHTHTTPHGMQRSCVCTRLALGHASGGDAHCQLGFATRFRMKPDAKWLSCH